VPTRSQHSTRVQSHWGTTRSGWLACGALWSMLLLASSASADDPSLVWIRQFGSGSSDKANSISVDALGNVFVGGSSDGNLSGINPTLSKGVVARLGTNGAISWIKQFGQFHETTDVSADEAGNFYATGLTREDTLSDVFLRKYGSTGTLEWSREIGSNNVDRGQSVAYTSGNVFVTGYTTGTFNGQSAQSSDALFVHYSSNGSLIRSRLIGSELNELGMGVAASVTGDVYVTGTVSGTGRGADSNVFLSKVNASGDEVWKKTFGTPSSDSGRAVATDALGNIFVTGTTTGAFGGTNAGGDDGFVLKLDVLGNVVWTSQFGINGTDDAQALAVDAAGNIYVAGSTTGNLGSTNAGQSDVFLRKLSQDGSVQWTFQFGGSGREEPGGISLDQFGNVYLAGWTNGSIAEPSFGYTDMWVAKVTDITPVPEPALLGLVAFLATPILSARRDRCCACNKQDEAETRKLCSLC